MDAGIKVGWMDGLPAEFYKIFWSNVNLISLIFNKDSLANVTWNDLLKIRDHDCTYRFP